MQLYFNVKQLKDWDMQGLKPGQVTRVTFCLGQAGLIRFIKPD